jgi:hypothetical protein
MCDEKDEIVLEMKLHKIRMMRDEEYKRLSKKRFEDFYAEILLQRPPEFLEESVRLIFNSKGLRRLAAAIKKYNSKRGIRFCFRENKSILILTRDKSS